MDPKSPATSSTPVSVKTQNPETLSSIAQNQNFVTPLITILNHMCFVKLDKNNYLLWQSMVLLVIKGNDLEGFIFGTKHCLKQFLFEGAEKKINPAFKDESILTNCCLDGSIIL